VLEMRGGRTASLQKCTLAPPLKFQFFMTELCQFVQTLIKIFPKNSSKMQLKFETFLNKISSLTSTNSISSDTQRFHCFCFILLLLGEPQDFQGFYASSRVSYWSSLLF